MAVDDQAYVISAAHYQETSALVRLLTSRHGLVSAVVRGVHATGRKSAALRAAIQLGNRVECQWSGKTSLKTIYHLELLGVSGLGSAEQFVCLTYVHELLLYFLREELLVDDVFPLYGSVLEGIGLHDMEQSLRTFEFGLLDCLGYGMDLGWDTESDAQVQPDLYYRLVPGSGLMLSGVHDAGAFPGSHLLAIQQRIYHDPALLKSAKRVSRLLLAFHMEGRPLKARQMYQELFGR